MNGLNGIILDGKVYKVIEGYDIMCKLCDIREFCEKQFNDYNVYICHGLSEDDPVYFRFSQSLTDKINEK